MRHEFKPGDLAVVVGCDHQPSNIGRVCELMHFLSHGDVVSNPNDPSIKSEYCDEGVQRWLVRGDNIENDSDDPIDYGLDVILPEHLMPLRGDFQSEQQKAKEEEPCL